MPFAPAGVPVLVASLGALIGLTRRARPRRGGAGMSTSVTLIAACAVITAAIKAAGPVVLGGRDLPAVHERRALLAPALLAALVVTQSLADGEHSRSATETVGVLAGGLVALRTGSVIGCVVVAAVVTAGCAPQIRASQGRALIRG